MKSVKSSYPFKDAPPEETVSRVQAILEEMGIPVHQDAYANNLGFLHSVRLVMNGFDYRVNGKAVTREYALASAHGEFKEMMKCLLDLIKDLGHNIYIRDVSFLGFNAYYVIVPDMSVIKVLSKGNWREVATCIPVTAYLTRLGELSDRALRDLAEDMENFIADESRPRHFPFYYYSGLPLDYTPWRGVTLQLVLALIYYTIGEMNKAYSYILEHIMLMENDQDVGDLELLCAFRDYLSLSLRFSQCSGRVANVLGQLYDSGTVGRVYDIAQERLGVLKMVRGFFPDFEQPRCWNCEQCPLSAHCRYTELEAVYLALKDAIRSNPIDQLSVRDIVWQRGI